MLERGDTQPSRDGPLPEEPPGIEEPPPPAATRTTVVLGVAVTLLVLGVAGVLAVNAGDEPAEPSVAGDEAFADIDEIPMLEPGEQPEGADALTPAGDVPLPRVELEGFAGAPAVDLGDYVGGTLVLNFWASWCEPCRIEMPELEQLAAAREDVTVLGVNLEDREQDAVALADEMGVTYDLAADPRGELFGEVGGFGMPTTLFVDIDGVIRYHHTGPLDADQMSAIVDEELDVDVDVP